MRGLLSSASVTEAGHAGGRGVAVVLALILLAALWLRVANLGVPSLWIDEYFHVGAAQEILRSGEPVLANGKVYTRALAYTYLVVGSFRLLGPSETSARLPSALLGMLVVVLVYLIGKSWLGVTPALVAAGLVAVSPVMVATARLGRMYSLFQILFLVGLWLYYRAVERDEDGWGSRFLWGFIAIAVGALSYSVHRLTFHLGIGLLAYWAIATVVDWRGRRTFLLAVTVGGTVFLHVTGLVDLVDLWAYASWMPYWMAPYGRDFYFHWWSEAHPVLLWLVVPAAGFAGCRYGRIGVLLSCVFVAAFAFQSLAFERKQVRYVSHLFPVFALLVAPLLVAAAQRGWEALRQRRDRWTRIPALPRWMLALLAIQLMILVSWRLLAPTIGAALSQQAEDSVAEWRPVYTALAGELRAGDAVVSLVPLSAAYYLERAGVELARMDGEPAARRDAQRWVVWQHNWPEGINAADLQAVVERYPRGWWIADDGRMANRTIVPSTMLAYVERELRFHPELSRPTVSVYSWGVEGEPR